MAKRQDKLAPDDIPRWVRCYDNPEYADRYTVIFTGRYPKPPGGEIFVVGMSGSPFSPQGVGIHNSYHPDALMEGNKPGQRPPKIGRRGNLGLRIAFADLSLDCQRVAWRTYADLWDLEVPETYR